MHGVGVKRLRMWRFFGGVSAFRNCRRGRREEGCGEECVCGCVAGDCMLSGNVMKCCGRQHEGCDAMCSVSGGDRRRRLCVG